MDRILLACKAARYAVDCDGLWAWGNAEVPVYSVNSGWWGFLPLRWHSRCGWFGFFAGIRVLPSWRGWFGLLVFALASALCLRASSVAPVRGGTYFSLPPQRKVGKRKRLTPPARVFA
jgi:hypothetical protein